MSEMEGGDQKEEDEEAIDEENYVIEKPEKVELEARYVAHRIKELLNSNYYIFDKNNGYRRATYKDIVVLLRSTKENAPIYEKEILSLDMPVFSDSSESYFKSLEIEVMLNLLKIIDNPMQDIPMVSVLRSNIGGFNDNELLEIGLNEKNITFYEKMLEYLKQQKKHECRSRRPRRTKRN